MPIRQTTHAGVAELPLHSVAPPAAVHAVRAGSGGCDASPFTHVSSVQGLPSSAGVSVSKIWSSTPPMPSQTLRLQSPVAWLLAPVRTVLAAVKFRPQTLLRQVFCWQNVSVPPGQVLALVQATPVPPVPPVPPAPPVPPFPLVRVQNSIRGEEFQR